MANSGGDFLNDIRKLDKQALPMTVQRFVALGVPREDQPSDGQSGAKLIIHPPQLEVSDASVGEALSKNRLSSNRKIVVLCPGAEFGPSKKWSTSGYTIVAQHYLAKGWQVWLMGSQNDADSCSEINTACDDRCNDLAGQTTLPEAIDLMSCASLVFSNDSGLMHIAAALQVPLVAILRLNRLKAYTAIESQPYHCATRAVL